MLRKFSFRHFFAAAAAAVVSVGCAADIEVAGTWQDDFGSAPVTITADAWGEATVVSFDNAERFAIIQNPADAEYNPSKFGKHIWTEPKDGVFYDCMVEYDLASAADAEASTKTADATDPANGGCGGFAWSKMTAVP